MPVACNVVRLQGTMPGGEVWSVSPKFGPNFGDLVTSFDDLEAWATAIGALNLGAVLPVNLRTIMSSQAAVTSVRCEYVDGTGTLADVAEFTLPDPQAGTGTPNKPFQTSMVASLATGRPGRSYRGRIYWPCLNVTLETSTLRVATGTCAGIATATAGWLRAVELAAPEGTAVRAAVVSQTLGVTTAVTQVRVGDVLDNQRRRRDSLAEGVSVAAYPPA